MVVSLTNNALTSIEPKPQSDGTQNERTAFQISPTLIELEATIPSPAYAPAIAPSVIVPANQLSTSTDATRPSFRKENVDETWAGDDGAVCCHLNDLCVVWRANDQFLEESLDCDNEFE